MNVLRIWSILNIELWSHNQLCQINTITKYPIYISTRITLYRVIKWDRRDPSLVSSLFIPPLFLHPYWSSSLLLFSTNSDHWHLTSPYPLSIPCTVWPTSLSPRVSRRYRINQDYGRSTVIIQAEKMPNYRQWKVSENDKSVEGSILLYVRAKVYCGYSIPDLP